MRVSLGRLAAAAFAVLAVGAAAVYLFWPERYAVNAPFRQLILHRGIEAPPADQILARLAAPRGFTVTRFAEGLAQARLLRVTETGDVIVTQPRSQRVVLLERDSNGDGRADGARELLAGLDRPHGLDLHGGWLSVAETGAIGRIRFDAAARATSGSYERIAKLPETGGHWTRTLRFGPDGLLYVTVGSDCNACVEQDPRRAAMLRFREDGSGQEIFATGLRNAVGFDFQSGTGDVYGADNGRDLLGDDFPPCELNLVVEGGFYGWPVANGDRVPDPEFGAGQQARIASSIPPVHAFRAHNSPLSVTFVRGADAPAAYRGAALVGLHGSWNRTRKDGYKVVSLHWKPDGSIQERDFLTGFLAGENVIGRPVDVAEGPDAFYVSDDYAGSVFRVSWGARETGAAPAPGAPAGPGAAADPLAPLGAEERASRAARGRLVYERLRCAQCHEGPGAPGVVVKPLDRLRGRYSLETLASYLETPNPPMPAFPMPEAELRDLAVYLLAREMR